MVYRFFGGRFADRDPHRRFHHFILILILGLVLAVFCRVTLLVTVVSRLVLSLTPHASRLNPKP